MSDRGIVPCFVGLVVALGALGACGRDKGDETSARDAGPATATGGSGGGGNAGGDASASTGGTGAGVGGAGAPGGAGGSAAGTGCARLQPITRRLWRLTSEQYVNAARDLLGLAATPAFAIVSSVDDGSSTRFLVNGPELQVQGNFLVDGLDVTARNIVAGVATRISGTCTGGPCLVTCTSGETQRACATRFARQLGARAFRRPLESAEVTGLLNVFSTVCPETSTACASEADFNVAIGLMVRALILAPSFLYRSELGPGPAVADAAGNYPDTTLTPYEVATQLAFMLLGSMPDDGLATAAGNGALGTTAGITTEVNRLLALPAVRANLTKVVTRWFDLGLLDDNPKAALLFSTPSIPATDQAAIALDLRGSAEAFVDDVLWVNPGAKLTDLLSSPKIFVNQRLAVLYGLPYSDAGATPGTFAPSIWPATQPHVGMLNQPAFLWASSAAAATSIVRRGTIIHNDVVCQNALLPLDLSSAEAQAVMALGDSEITRSDARLAAGNLCADNCHSQIDPYGRILQDFDTVGRFRTVDDVGRAVVDTGSFTPPSALAPRTISGTAALVEALLSTKVFTGCAMQKMTSYAIGGALRASDTADTCELTDLRAQFDRSDGTAASLFSAIAQATFLRARAGGSQ